VRVEATLDELSDRGVRRLQLDCSRVRHVEFGAVRTLTGALSRFAPKGLSLRGLSPHLRDLFRLAGCGEFVPTGFASGLLAPLPSEGPQREWAT
jgi:anti-anti-sigma regulatory factor